MRILVTGSSGFIGRFLIPELIAKGHEVVGLDVCVGPEFGGGFRFSRGNVLDAGVVGRSMEGVDGVIHLAAEHKDFGVPDVLYHEVNVEGTKNLLRCATAHAVEKFVFFSSVAVYGTSPVPTYEGLKCSPELPYGRTKLLAEHAVEEWARTDRCRSAVMIRPTVVFGPFNRANMFRLIDAVAGRRYISVGDGQNIKSLAYVENLTSATVFLLDRMRAGVEVFNYADSPHLTTRELVQCIAGALGVRVPGIRIPKSMALTCALPFDVVAKMTGRDLPLTAKRIRKFTDATHHLAERIREQGCRAPFSLEEGIRRTIEWYLEDQGERNAGGLSAGVRNECQ